MHTLMNASEIGSIDQSVFNRGACKAVVATEVSELAWSCMALPQSRGVARC